MSRLIRDSIGFVSLCDVIIQKTHATLSTNQMQNFNQSRLGFSRFPALQTVGPFLPWDFIGSLWDFPLFWWAVVICSTFGLIQPKCVLINPLPTVTQSITAQNNRPFSQLASNPSLTLYTLTSVCKLSILCSINFLRCCRMKNLFNNQELP